MNRRAKSEANSAFPASMNSRETLDFDTPTESAISPINKDQPPPTYQPSTKNWTASSLVINTCLG